MPDTLIVDGLKVGQRYRVQFQSIRSVKEFVASYLGPDHLGELGFNLRPLAGTTGLPAKHILQMWETDAPTSLASKPAVDTSKWSEVRVF